MINPLKAKIGGAYETWLIVMLIPLLLMNNKVIYHILPINYVLVEIIHGVSIFIIIFCLIDSIWGHEFRQSIVTELRFRSSKIKQQDKLLMRELGIGLGYTTDNGEYINVPYGVLLKHVLLLGSTGSGKTSFMKLMLWQNVVNGGGGIFIDGKMDYNDFQGFYDLCYAIGRHNDILVVSPGNPEKSNTYNPVINGDTQEIASRIISLLPQDARADFYRNEGFKTLVVLISAMKKLTDVFNMTDLSILMSNENAILYLETQLKEKYPNSVETLEFSLYLDGYRENGKLNFAKLKGNISGTASKPFTFGLGDMANICNDYNPEVNLLECIKNNKIVYVMLPTMNKPDASKEFGKIFLSDFRTVVGWLQQDFTLRPKIPYLVIMDEAGGYANENWDTLFQQCRSANISLIVSAQSVSNFDDVSNTFFNKIKENTLTSIFMKLQSNESKETVADLIGQQYKTSLSLNQSRNKSDSGSTQTITSQTRSDGATTSLTQSLKRENIVNKEELSSIDTGEAIVFYDGRLVFHIKSPFISSKMHQPFIIHKPIITTKNQGLHLINQLDKFLKPINESKNNGGTSKGQQINDDCNTDIMAISPKF
ncbi:MAG: type IV secretion system DNA-binding domain-containing protein [Burkholderiales bacterium]|nr:type IV secretion system DNA-binding domain-containing protein [Burkholderiales bacterium]